MKLDRTKKQDAVIFALFIGSVLYFEPGKYWVIAGLIGILAYFIVHLVSTKGKAAKQVTPYDSIAALDFHKVETSGLMDQKVPH